MGREGGEGGGERRGRGCVRYKTDMTTRFPQMINYSQEVSSTLLVVLSLLKFPHLVESEIEFRVQLGPGQDKITAGIMHGEVTDEYTALIQVFRAVHTMGGCVCVCVCVCVWGGGGEGVREWNMAAHAGLVSMCSKE